MFRFNHAVIIAASIAGLGVVPSAHGQSANALVYVTSQDVARPKNVCAIDLASMACAQHQTRQIQAAAKVRGTARSRATLEEIGRRQMDALIGSLD